VIFSKSKAPSAVQKRFSTGGEEQQDHLVRPSFLFRDSPAPWPPSTPRCFCLFGAVLCCGRPREQSRGGVVAKRVESQQAGDEMM